MPNFIERFQALFRPRESIVQSATMVEPPLRTSAMQRLFSAENDRRSVVYDCQRMYYDDTRAQGVIKALARDTVKAGFELNISGPRSSEASKIAWDMIKRLQIMKYLEQWVNSTLRDGDTFLELGANIDGLIVELSRKPTLELHRWSDDFDKFYDSRKAFFWTDQAWNGLNPPQSAVYFAEWQIIHARADHDENSRYGRPLFASARKAYKRLSEGELDIAIRRKVRAGMRMSHVLEDGTEADIEAYKVRNRSVLTDPFAALSDYFSNKKTSITAIQGDANLNQIEDVEHHIHTWWIASPTPMALLGYGKDLNRDILNEQKEQYDGTKESLSAWLSEEILRPLIERQWLLLGIWPDSLEWSIEWATKDSLTADILLKAAQALAALNATGKFTDETLLRLFSRFVPDFDADAEIEALLAKQLEEQAIEEQRIAENARIAEEQAVQAIPEEPTPVPEEPTPVSIEDMTPAEIRKIQVRAHERSLNGKVTA